MFSDQAVAHLCHGVPRWLFLHQPWGDFPIPTLVTRLFAYFHSLFCFPMAPLGRIVVGCVLYQSPLMHGAQIMKMKYKLWAEHGINFKGHLH